jgi:hypothetical protein
MDISETQEIRQVARIGERGLKPLNEQGQSETRRRKRKTGPIYTIRDQWLIEALYRGRGLTEEQIARMFFPSREYLKNPNTEKQRYSLSGVKMRMPTLQEMGFVLTQRYTPIGETRAVRYWYLTQRRFKGEARAAGRPEETYPDMVERLSHHFKVTDIYAGIYSLFRELLSDLPVEGYQQWEWKNERKSACEFQYEGRTRQHKPDAEINMPDGQIYFIERQTKESRKTQEVFHEKVENAKSYINWSELTNPKPKLMFACDEERDRRYAKKALEDFGLQGAVSSPESLVARLNNHAKQIADGVSEASQAGTETGSSEAV